MEFDKSRIYTMINADEIKPGDIGYFADDLYSLQQTVQYEDKEYYGQVIHIRDNKTAFRFASNRNMCFVLFYPVEEPEKRKFHPFKNTDDLMTEFCKRSGKLPLATIDPPAIYFKNKQSGKSYIMSAFDYYSVKICHETYDMTGLFNNFTFTDDLPCGIEEE